MCNSITYMYGIKWQQNKFVWENKTFVVFILQMAHYMATGGP